MNIGDTINGYTILSKVGEGGFGVVYKVAKNKHYFAMKSILPDANQEQIMRFRREVRMLMSVKDEHVIEVVDYDLDDNSPYFIMPLCSESLTTKVRAGMSEEEGLTACIDFCKGIQAIHHAKMCHRDIKPDNALFLNGVLKITDLGVGRFENRDTTTLTQYGDQIYTEGYRPPEYRTDDSDAFREFTAQGDIYMIGKSIYFVLTHGGDVTDVDLTAVSIDVAPIIERCLKTSLNDRYSTVDELLDDLVTIQNVRKKIQKIPKSLDEILIEPMPIRYDDLYNRLLADSDDEKSLYELLKSVDDMTLTALFTQKRSLLSNYIGRFNQTLRNPKGWIMFEYVEVYVNAIKIMFFLCSTPYHKQLLLDLAFDLAIQYNRYPAMLIIGDILSSLSDADARALSIFFMRRKDDILHMKPNFKHPVHYLINNLISSTRTIS